MSGSSEILCISTFSSRSIGLFSPQSHLDQLLFLLPWQDFFESVHALHRNVTWRKKTLALTLKTRDPYALANVEIGDEHGLLGRFHKHFGDVINSVFNSQGIGIRFADFKSVRSTFSGTPDVIMRDKNHRIKVAGELKVPWIQQHSPRYKYNDIDCFREVLAQPIKYMQAVGCLYGFLSNYEETIFLRQLVDSEGIWSIEYSPVVLSTDFCEKHRPSSPVVSARQCFFFVGCEALKHEGVRNTTPYWVLRK
ncbi:hypothetical protein PDE_01226 [Penicillium oxalicum 114-2]|uniref:Uncharacterized protein n=1 Tax=Penicillium oxalicum (strain 114-2 / CGMCC 5302) TaxID=933388 RepID=S7Z6W0_PENO1|nr:hypothetical protein PDE_01226 [Penicillium oxalicum 114-2]